MSLPDLIAIQLREQNATPGKWTRDGATVRSSTFPLPVAHCCGGMLSEADAEFIAHAREDIPALLARVEQLEDAVRASIPNLGGWAAEQLEKALRGER